MQRRVVNVFKGAINLNPSLLGNNWNLKLSIIKGFVVGLFYFRRHDDAYEVASGWRQYSESCDQFDTVALQHLLREL
jgi:hypothetical protein